MPHFNLMQYVVTLLLNLQDMIDQGMIERMTIYKGNKMLFAFILLSLISSIDLAFSCLVTWKKKSLKYITYNEL